MTAGAHTIRAIYGGNAEYNGSESAGHVHNVESGAALVISAIYEMTVDGDIVIEWPGTSGWYYTVKTKPYLYPYVAWSNLTGYVDIPGVNGTMSAIDTNAVSQYRFYRIFMHQ
jgi:hypothetical protein